MPALTEFTDAGQKVLADLGYKGERHRFTCPDRIFKDEEVLDDERQFNLAHAHFRTRTRTRTRTRAEQDHIWPKGHRAVRKVTLCPWRIEAITALRSAAVRCDPLRSAAIRCDPRRLALEHDHAT